MADVWVHATLWALALLLAALAGRLIARGRGRLSGIGLGLCRVVLIGLLSLLLWEVIRSRREQIVSRPKTEAESSALVVVEDRSMSMDLGGPDGRKRGDLARDVWDDLQGIAGAAVPVRRVFFARNLVDEADRSALRADATNTAGALSACLAREDVGAVLIVSDGASTDGAVPAYVLDWARNRGVPVFAVCAAEKGGSAVDVALRRLDCSPINPRHIEVHVTCAKVEPGRSARLELFVDGGLRSEQTVGLQPSYLYRIAAPLLTEGWHEYEVRISPDFAEATDLNNSSRGVFMSTGARAILFIAGAPRPGDPQIVSVLRELWGGRVRAVSARDPALKQIDPDKVCLVLMSDARPAGIPRDLRRSIESGRLPCITLAGDSIATSVAAGAEGIPLDRAGPAVRLPGTSGGGAAVVKGRDAAICGLGDLDTDGLEIDYVYESAPQSGSHVLLHARGRECSYPLLVANSLTGPMHAVFLSDVAWKWALHPDPRKRTAYRTLWSQLVECQISREGPGEPLDIDFAREPGGGERTLVRVRAANGDGSDGLAEVRLQIDAGRGGERVVEMERRTDSYEHTYEHDAASQVVWFLASALKDGATLRSERRPLVLPRSATEFMDLSPHPERLRKLASGPDHFADYEGRGCVLRRALEAARPAPEVSHFRTSGQRVAGREWLLALACFLIAGLEWLIERRAYVRTEAKL